MTRGAADLAARWSLTPNTVIEIDSIGKSLTVLRARDATAARGGLAWLRFDTVGESVALRANLSGSGHSLHYLS